MGLQTPATGTLVTRVANVVSSSSYNSMSLCVAIRINLTIKRMHRNAKTSVPCSATISFSTMRLTRGVALTRQEKVAFINYDLELAFSAVLPKYYFS
jgi:hypothetical protein